VDVSIVIPAYNEEDSIAEVIAEIDKAFSTCEGDHEFIVVNDGSTDKTNEAVKQTRARFFEHSINRGYGAAIKTGIKKAQYDVILIVDADGTYPAEQIPEMIGHIKNYDMVVAARTGKSVRIPMIRRPAKWLINKLANYLSEFNIPDLNSGLRLMRREVVEKFLSILPNGFSFTSTITLAMLTNGYSVKYVPIDYRKRIGRSKIRPIKDTLNFIQLVIRTVIYFNPLKIFVPMSLSLFLLSMLVLFYSFFFTPQIMDVTTIVLFVSALQLLAIGMVADLIDKRTKR